MRGLSNITNNPALGFLPSPDRRRALGNAREINVNRKHEGEAVHIDINLAAPDGIGRHGLNKRWQTTLHATRPPTTQDKALSATPSNLAWSIA